MNTTINYEKYEAMSKRNIFNQLLKAEAKLSALEQDFKEKISAQKELVKFLRAKTKSKIYEKEIAIPALDKAIKEFNSGETKLYSSYEEYKAKIDE